MKLLIYIKHFLIYAIFFNTITICSSSTVTKKKEEYLFCKKNVLIYYNASPFLGKFTDLYHVYEGIHDLSSCIDVCCSLPQCHLTFFLEHICFTYRCTSAQSCVIVKGNGTVSTMGSPIRKRSIRSLAKPYKTCELGLQQCLENEICKPINNRSRNGLCICKEGYVYDNNGMCIPFPKDVFTVQNFTENVSTNDIFMTTPMVKNTFASSTDVPTASTAKSIYMVVNVNNKTVSIPEDKLIYEDPVTLSAYAIGAPKNCKYEWQLLTPHDSNEHGLVTDFNSQTITLSHLVSDVYVFKVFVDCIGAHGEATGNVTVLPGVILDGSGSTDDSEIKSFSWQMVTGPLGYSLPNENGQSLQLTDLIPGNYAIMSVATETELNGNASSDDHGIVEWEWTKGPEDSGKAVDMQNTRTPYLKLSTLEEGIYHFILRVADASGQSASASAHVYVHQPDTALPKADAGENLTIVLPNSTVTLDGSRTVNISPLTKFLWEQLSGPNTVIFSSQNAVKVNVSSLTKGVYLFLLTAWNNDNEAHKSVSNITVSVFQVASAGGDFSVTLPVSVIVVNGSKSSDDVRIARWQWEREPSSLAAGIIINDAAHSCVLMVTDVVPGRYVWKLTVWDDQGVSSSDTVSVIVKESEHYLEEVEIVLAADISSFSTGEVDTVLQKLQLLLHQPSSEITFSLLSLTGKSHVGRVSMVVLGYRDGKVARGTTVAWELWQQLKSEKRRLLDFPILSIDTMYCQNNCSDHGECIQASRECRCESWWMESPLRRHLGDGQSNCDWSIIYVFVTVIVLLILAGAGGWGASYLLMKQTNEGQKGYRSRRQNNKTPKYALLDSYENNRAVPQVLSSDLLESESDSDNEVIFDSRQQNGNIKLQRIKT